MGHIEVYTLASQWVHDQSHARTEMLSLLGKAKLARLCSAEPIGDSLAWKPELLPPRDAVN